MANTTRAYGDLYRDGSWGVTPRTPSATSSAASRAETPPPLLAKSNEPQLEHARLRTSTVWRDSAGRVEAVAGTFKAQEVANTLWAYARMGREHGVGLRRSLEERILQVVADFMSQDIADTKLAYSQMGAGLFCLVTAGAICTRALFDAAVLGCRMLLWVLKLLWALCKDIWPSSPMTPAVALAATVWGVSAGCSAPWGLMCAAIVVFFKGISDARARSSEWRRTLLD